MPRNGSGAMSLTTSFVPETDALAEDVNTVLEDIRDEITNSLAADGQTAMTGAFRAVDGSAAAPGITFASDLDTGIYRIGSNSFGVTANGAIVATINASGITLASGKTLTVGGSSVTAIPSGVIVMWSGTVAAIPSGWFLCNGLNGTPDLRDRFVIGARQDDAGVAKTNVTGALTTSGGSKDAVNVSHTHTATVTDAGHTHTTELNYTTVGAVGSSRQWYGRTGTLDVSASADAKASSSATTGITVANSTEGSSGTNANLPPYYALAFIMKA
jgi:hypothetical protein